MSEPFKFDPDVEPRTLYGYRKADVRKHVGRWVVVKETGEKFFEHTLTDGNGQVLAHSLTPEDDILKP